MFFFSPKDLKKSDCTASPRRPLRRRITARLSGARFTSRAAEPNDQGLSRPRVDGKEHLRRSNPLLRGVVDRLHAADGESKNVLFDARATHERAETGSSKAAQDGGALFLTATGLDLRELLRAPPKSVRTSDRRLQSQEAPEGADPSRRRGGFPARTALIESRADRGALRRLSGRPQSLSTICSREPACSTGRA